MKSVVFISVLLLVLFTFTSATRSQNCDSVGVVAATTLNVAEDEIVMEVEEEENVLAYFGNDFCNPKTTCSYRCYCGKYIYIGLKESKSWKKFEQRYARDCRKGSMKTWLEDSVKDISKKYNFFSRAAVKNVIADWINPRLKQYKAECKDSSIISQMDNAFSVVGHWFHDRFLWVHGKDFVPKVQKDAKKLFDDFVSRAKRGDWSFCSCSIYLNYYHGLERIHKYSEMMNLCSSKCRGGR